MPLDGGEARALTDLPLGAADPRWLPDSRSVVVISEVLRSAPTLDGTRAALEVLAKSHAKVHVTEDRLYKFWDRWLTRGEVPHFFVVDVASGATRDLTPDNDRFFELMDPSGTWDISPDGAELAYSALLSEPPYAGVLRYGVFTVALAGGPARCLTADHPAEDARPRYTPDGRFLVWGMTRDPDFYADRTRLARLDRATGTLTVLTETWDRSPTAWTPMPDGRTLVIEAEEDGRARLFRMSIEGGTPEPFVRDGSALGARVVDAGRVTFVHDSLAHPPEPRVVAVDGSAMRRFGGFNDTLLAGLELGRTEELRVAGADGDPIQVWVVHPPASRASARPPLVHLIHGGPHGTFGDHWHYRWNAQLFAAPGYVAALVNFHGSSSYGEKFLRSIHGTWGDRPSKDVHAATDHLVKTGAVDPERVAITGGSYGGYLVSWLIGAAGKRFKCAVAHAAVTRFAGMYAGDVTEGMQHELGGTPWENREALERWDPLAFSKDLCTPTLVVHGEKDYRVPVAQGLELYGILKARGVPARLVYFPGENHWVLNPANSLQWYAEVHAWLARWLTPSS